MENYDFEKIIDVVRNKTAMYTGSNSLYSLAAFISGASYILYELDIESSGAIPGSDFTCWVNKNLNFGGSSAGWEMIITAVTLGFKTCHEVPGWDNLERLATDKDHRKAKELFYKLFDEYRKSFTLEAI